MKEKQQKPANEALLKLIPQRHMIRLKDFPSASNMKMPAVEGADYTELTEAVLAEQKYFEKNATEKARFCYIAHQKKDGILSARALKGKIRSKDKKIPDPVYNPAVDEKNMSAHIKWPRLRERALVEGLVEKEKLPLSGIILSVVSGIVLIMDLLIKIFEITDYTGDNAFLNILKSFNAGLVLTGILIALVAASVYLIVAHTRKNRATLTSKINKALYELEIDKFVEFLSGFDGDDLCISDCDGSRIFLCVLQNYSIKERYVLNAYWRLAAHHQLWWIFAEATGENEAFVVPADQGYDRRFYFQKPLAKAEKRRIAKETYVGAKIAPLDDSGVNTFGVDWICRFQLKERTPIADIQQLKQKLDSFCAACANRGYQTDIKLMIRLVADLTCTYGFDFTIRRNWEYLFSDNQGDSVLAMLDKQVTEALNLNNTAFRNLIPEIMDVFSEHLEEIVANYPNSEQTSEYEQWCIIKALKTRAAAPEECYLSVCDTLMAEFAASEQNPEDIGGSDRWREILVKTAEIFYKKQVFWFLPTLMHNLLKFFGGRSEQRLFSQGLILEIARSNLLLSMQGGADDYQSLPIDPVRDHYEIVCAAVAEKGNAARLEDNASVPAAFEMLQFTNSERRRYYNALHILNERAIVEFIECLFDMFCAVVSTNESDAKFCYSVLYEKSLYEQYLEKTGLHANRRNYVMVIAGRLLALLDSCFGTMNGSVKNSICCLKKLHEERQAVDELLLLVAELDVLGFNTLNFIACVIGLTNDSEEITRDIYLNLGNYLLGVVFLAYYELQQQTFYNEDYKYLISICTGYQEPGSTMLGFLFLMDTRLTPTNSGARIHQYIERHKATYLENLRDLAKRIKYKDIEDFFVYLACFESASQEEKHPVYKEIQQRIESNFGAETQSKLYLELISLTLKDRSTPEFAELAPEAIIKALSEQSDDMIYLLYRRYYELWESEYIGFCHDMAPAIMKCRFVGNVRLIVGCLLNSKNSCAPEAFAETSRLVYSRLETQLQNKGIADIMVFIMFVGTLRERLREMPELYKWTSESELGSMLSKMDLQRVNLIKLQMEAFCTERQWTNYGIALYLRELMISAFLEAYRPEDYVADSEKEVKTDYFVNHFLGMTPLVEIEEQVKLSVPYLEMLTAFIHNTDDIQHALDEKECMRKLLKDLRMMVEKHTGIGEDQKFRVRRLIDEYNRKSN